ncbi:MAG: hypothetical protein Q8Q36_01655 [bacterium]|nr:hypothetical protein [bacterium]
MKVRVTWLCAYVEVRRSETPPSSLMFLRTVLNLAVKLRFNLGLNFSCEGGLQGKYRGRYVSLQNMGDGDLGLMLEDGDLLHSRSSAEILAWYGTLLWWLAESPTLSVNGKDYGHGKIFDLSLDPSNPAAYFREMHGILSAVFRKASKSKVLGEKVFREFAAQGSLEGVYLRGLSDADIKRIFVPLP